jgi:hypothetical protein
MDDIDAGDRTGEYSVKSSYFANPFVNGSFVSENETGGPLVCRDWYFVTHDPPPLTRNLSDIYAEAKFDDNCASCRNGLDSFSGW